MKIKSIKVNSSKKKNRKKNTRKVSIEDSIKSSQQNKNKDCAILCFKEKNKNLVNLLTTSSRKCIFHSIETDCDNYRKNCDILTKINTRLKKIFKIDINTETIVCKPIVQGLEGGKSGAIIFNLYNTGMNKSTNSNKINNKYKMDEYIGKTLVDESIARNSNISFLYYNKFIEKYVDYIENNSDTYLVKIYFIGFFKIDNEYKLSIIMENIKNNVNMEPLKRIQMSNSYSNNYNINLHKSIGFDFKTTNVPFDSKMNFEETLALKNKVRKYKIKLNKNILKRDIDFLNKNNRIDYSSMLFIKDGEYKYRIIDFLQPYTFKKKLEDVFKNQFGIKTSITNPNDYSTKFINLIDELFF